MKKLFLLLFLIPHLVIAELTMAIQDEKKKESLMFYAGHYYAAVITANKFKTSECPPPKNNTIPTLKAAESDILSALSLDNKKEFLKIKNSSSLQNAMKNNWNLIKKGIALKRSAGIDCTEIQGFLLWPSFHTSTINWEKAKLQNK